MLESPSAHSHPRLERLVHTPAVPWPRRVPRHQHLPLFHGCRDFHLLFLPPSLRAPSVPLSFLSVHPTFRVDPDFRVSVPTAASVLPRSLAEEVAHSTAAAHAPNRFQTGKSFSGRQITAQVPSCSFSLFQLVHSSVFWDLVILYHL